MGEAERESKSEEERRLAHYLASDANEKLIINLRDLGHVMRFLYEGKASQKRILIILRETGPITQSALTERLGIRPGSASEILAKLESAGSIGRVTNAGDRRTADVFLTEAGKAQADEALRMRRERHRDMFACLTEEQKEELLALLETLSLDWKRYQADAHRGCRCHGGGACRGEVDPQ